MSSSSGQTSPQTVGWYPWYVAIILSVAATLSYVDRQVMGLLTEAVKADLKLTDFQVSLLHGLAFVLFYSTMAVPLGYLSDRMPRRTIIGFGILFWSFATAACGLARSFWSLFAARLCIGVGEATLMPGAYSLLPDYLDEKKLPRAFAFFSIGSFLGNGLAFAGGGAVLALAMTSSAVVLPFFGELKPWQVTFLVAAAPGPFIALLMLTVREPARRHNPRLQTSVEDTVGFKQFVASRKLFLISHLLAAGLLALMGWGIASWTTSFFVRTFGWTTAEIGFAYGMIWIFVSGSGSFLGSRIVHVWMDGGGIDARQRMIMWSFALLVPFAIIYPLCTNAYVALAVLAAYNFCLGAFVTMMPAILQLATPHAYRGRISGAYTFSSGAIGAALGPIAVASVTDFILKDSQRLNHSLAIVCAVVGPIMVALIWVAHREFVRQTAPAETKGAA